MFLLKFCEGVVALEFVASEACDWPQRQKAVLCGWHFYQWDVTFQDECVRSDLKDIQLVSDVRIVQLVHGWAKPPSFLFIYLSVCFLTHILGQVYLYTPANAVIRRQAREDCERSSPAWATEGGESLFLQGGKKKTLIFFLYAEYLKILNFRLSFEPVWYWLSSSDSKFLHMATWSVVSALWSLGILLELLSSLALLFYRIDLSRTVSELHWHTLVSTTGEDTSENNLWKWL